MDKMRETAEKIIRRGNNYTGWGLDILPYVFDHFGKDTDKWVENAKQWLKTHPYGKETFEGGWIMNEDKSIPKLDLSEENLIKMKGYAKTGYAIADPDQAFQLIEEIQRLRKESIWNQSPISADHAQVKYYKGHEQLEGVSEMYSRELPKKENTIFIPGEEYQGTYLGCACSVIYIKDMGCERFKGVCIGSVEKDFVGKVIDILSIHNFYKTGKH